MKKVAYFFYMLAVSLVTADIYAQAQDQTLSDDRTPNSLTTSANWWYAGATVVLVLLAVIFLSRRTDIFRRRSAAGDNRPEISPDPSINPNKDKLPGKYILLIALIAIILIALVFWMVMM